jgi:porin
MSKLTKKILLCIFMVWPIYPAFGQDKPDSWLAVDAVYKGDVIGVAHGGLRTGMRGVHDLDIVGTADLEKALSWPGATVFVDLLDTVGGHPNNLSGSLQGIDNIEVTRSRAKIYQAWIEQSLAGGSVKLLAGLYDINADFYHNDAAGLLISPPFGMGAELSATGPNGPSTFPSTALALRARATTGSFYVEAAVVNARAGTIGDPEGVDMSGRDGALILAEGGLTRNGKLAVGVWRYTRRQPKVTADGASADDGLVTSQGLYVLAEGTLTGKEGAPGHVSYFARAGVSDGRSTPYGGGWQIGLLVARPIKQRADSQLSFGIADGILSAHYRRLNDGSTLRHKHERIVELTYSDRIFGHTLLQPDIQYVIHPVGDETARNALVIGLRAQIALHLH